MADYEGIPGTGTTSGVIFVPENIPHYYDENGVLKVVAVGYDSQGNIPASDPAPENQAPGYHRSTFNPANTNTPDYVKVVFPPSPFQPGYTDNPKTNPAAQWVVALDAAGDPVYGTPPAAGGSVQAQAAALAVAAVALSQALGKK